MCMDESFMCSRDDGEITAYTKDGSVSLSQILETLQESGLYWRDLSKDEAENLLRRAITGAFLLRDSSHPRYLFTLTLRTFSGVTNIRVIMEKGRYKLEAYDSGKLKTPSFETVLMLITYYVKLSRRILQQNTIQDIERTDHLYLTKPLYKKVCSLQHLCRRTINQSLKSGSLSQLPIPDKAKSYLARYPFPV